MTEDVFVKDARDIKRNLHVEQGDSGVFVYAIAVSKEVIDSFISIPAKFGTPLGNECYDMVKDVYYVEGRSYLEIGEIPINYRLVDSTNCWVSDIPLPRSVMKRYMTEEQKKKMSEWKSQYSSSLYNIEFLQVLSVY
jgi:hypothetical protein